MSKFEKEFKNPKREYGIYPIKHERFSLDEEVEYIDRCNFAGVVGNVNYTGFPNNDDEWKKAKDGFLKYAKKGLKTWIYDEKGYPSLTAGGAVLDKYPEYESIALFCYQYRKTLTGPSKSYRADATDGELYKAYIVPIDGSEPIDITDKANERGTLIFDVPQGVYYLVFMTIRKLYDGTHAAHSFSEPRRTPNHLQKEAVEAFVELTHENYAKHVKEEFGKSIRAFFTDEPALLSYNIVNVTYPYLCWRRDFPEVFKARYGYDIDKAVCSVVTGLGSDCIKQRCDFWEFTADEYAKNYFGTIREFCHKNGLMSSGHLLAEEKLSDHVPCYGSYYTCVKELDWPGIDQLETEPSNLMLEDRLPIARLAASVADVYGTHETFTEASDYCSRAENRQVSMDWIYASMNWHFAQGINNVTSYYAFYPFEENALVELNKYVARLKTMSLRGERESKVALLYPDSTLWAYFELNEQARTDKQPKKIEDLNEIFKDTSWQLIHRQIDYDYINEDVILDAKITDGELSFKKRRYSCVILAGASVVKKTTAQKLIRFMSAGGKVIIVGDIPTYDRDTGKKMNLMEKLVPFISKGNLELVSVNGAWKLPSSKVLPRTIRLVPNDLSTLLIGENAGADVDKDDVVSNSIMSHVRLDKNTRYIFLCNMWGKNYSGKLTVCGKSCKLADPKTGAIQEIEVVRKGENIEIPVELENYQGLVYIVEQTESAGEKKKISKKTFSRFDTYHELNS